VVVAMDQTSGEHHVLHGALALDRGINTSGHIVPNISLTRLWSGAAGSAAGHQSRGTVFATRSVSRAVHLHFHSPATAELTSLELTAVTTELSSQAVPLAVQFTCTLLKTVAAVSAAAVDFGTPSALGDATFPDGLVLLPPPRADGGPAEASVLELYLGQGRVALVAVEDESGNSLAISGVDAPAECGGVYLTSTDGTRFFGVLQLTPTSPLLRTCLEMLEPVAGCPGGATGITTTWVVDTTQCALELRRASLPLSHGVDGTDWAAFASACAALFCQRGKEPSAPHEVDNTIQTPWDSLLHSPEHTQLVVCSRRTPILRICHPSYRIRG
jgi:hypothetical protein